MIESNVDSVAGGAHHTLALVNGNVYSWGRNSQWQLGYPHTTDNQLSPVQIISGGNIETIIAGALSSAAVCIEGNLYAWGYNNARQVSPSSVQLHFREPTRIKELESIYSVSISMNENGHSLAINTYRNAWMWGNLEGAIILPTQIIFENTSQTYAITFPHEPIPVAAGDTHSLSIENGVLWAWGGNNYGQLGNGTNVGSSHPIKIMENVFSVATGAHHSFAILHDGSLWAWGRNTHGQLGDGTTENRNVPVRIMESVIEVTTGFNHTLARDYYGNVWAWGYNGSGRLGTGSVEAKLTPTNITEFFYQNGQSNQIIQVSAGRVHSMALDENRYLWVWGEWNWGDYLQNNNYLPQRTEINSILSVSAGNRYAMLIDTNRNLLAWGHNVYGRLGTGTNSPQHQPVLVCDDRTWELVVAGSTHTVAIDSYRGSRRLWIWGNNNNLLEPLVDNTTEYTPSPMRVDNIAVSRISVGANHTLARCPNGNVLAWGCNSFGQLGNGARVVYYTPISFDGTPIDRDIVHRHTLYIYNSTLRGFGNNRHMQLIDDDTVTYISSETSIPIMESVRFIDYAVGRLHSFAITYDGHLYAWGDNRFGQLGNGIRTTTLQPPRRIIEDVEFLYVVAGDFHALAIDTNYNLWVWGNNEFGQLGNGNTERNITPTRLDLNINIVNVVARADFSHAQDANGYWWIWGGRNYAWTTSLYPEGRIERVAQHVRKDEFHG